MAQQYKHIFYKLVFDFQEKTKITSITKVILENHCTL